MRTSAPPTSWYRADITGLRAFAIIPVVAFHAGATFIPGGFIGVDVFYVISGFLITTLLVSEVERSGSIDLGAFWARRVRRLVPALALCIVVSLPIAAVLTSVLQWSDLARQAAASGVFLANVLFWRDATDYFNTADTPSPFLHMWSLGVEEQFHVLWPLLVVLACSTPWPRWSLRARLCVALGVVFTGSLGLSILTTPTHPDAAFYLLHTRAWEFAGGGLAALLPLSRLVSKPAITRALAFVGASLLAFGLLTIKETDLYPGHLALIPFVATVCLLLAGGGTHSPLAAILESRIAVWFGQVSYSWYLWHWPLIVFAFALFPANAAAPAIAALVSLGVATVSFTFVEEPLRRSRRLALSHRRTFVAGVAALALAVGLGGVVGFAGKELEKREPLETYASAARTLPATGCAGAVERLVGAITTCVLGDPDSRTTIAFIGDSHAGHWRAAADAAARDAGVRLIFRWRSSCPSLDLPIGDSRAVQDPACDRYRDETMRILDDARPRAVLISNAYGYFGKILGTDGQPLEPSQQLRAWGAGLARQIDTFRSWGAHVAVVLDNPRMTFNPTACLGRLGHSAKNCSEDLQTAQSLIREFKTVTDSVVSDEHVDVTFSVDEAICPRGYCSPLSSKGIPVYQDQTHLSRAWTMTQVPRLAKVIRRISAE